jgi:heme-degrading monooxygenase HmoA
VIAVIFEVTPFAEHKPTYLDIASDLRPMLDGIEGFISIERFASLSDPTKILSLSFWRNEEAVQQWRNTSEHRDAQHAGRARVFADYRLRIAQVVRDYGLNERAEVPADSRAIHDHPDVWPDSSSGC